MKDIDIPFVTCQICGKQLNQVGNLHLRIHHITLREYQDRYPGADIISTPASAQKSKACRLGHPVRWSKEENHKKQSDLLARTRKDPKNVSIFLEVGRKSMEKVNESNRHRWETDPEYRKRVSAVRSDNLTKSLHNLWDNDDAWNERAVSRALENGLNAVTRFGVRSIPYLCPDGSTIKMRSSYEIALAKFFDSLGVKWEYETSRFEYNVEGDSAYYIPDFFLPELNFFVEVKSRFYLEKDRVFVEAKLEAVRRAGHDIFLVTEDTWSEFMDMLSSIVKRSSALESKEVISETQKVH